MVSPLKVYSLQAELGNLRLQQKPMLPWQKWVIRERVQVAPVGEYCGRFVEGDVMVSALVANTSRRCREFMNVGGGMERQVTSNCCLWAFMFMSTSHRRT